MAKLQCVCQLLVAMVTAALASESPLVEWRYFAWQNDTADQLPLPKDFQKMLPENEMLATQIICSTLTNLPANSHVVSLSGSKYHPSLNRVCAATGAACIYMSDSPLHWVPPRWRSHAIELYPAAELHSIAVESYLEWAMWREFAVLFVHFGDLRKLRSILEYTEKSVTLRALPMDDRGRCFKLLEELRHTTVHRFLLDIPQHLVPLFFDLAAAANLTNMVYDYIFIRDMDTKFYTESIASRLFSGMNCTLLRPVLPGVTHKDGELLDVQQQHEFVRKLVKAAHSRWLKELGISPPRNGLRPNTVLSESSDIVAAACFGEQADSNATSWFRDILREEIESRIGMVEIKNKKVYNFSFTVNHMYPQGLPMTRAGKAGTFSKNGIAVYAKWSADTGFNILPGARQQHFDYYEGFLRNMNLSVVTVIDPPFSFRREFDEDGNRLSGNDQWTGFSIELFKRVAEELESKYTIHESKDGQFGGPVEDPQGKVTWSGTVGELMHGMADVAVASLVITYDRERVIDFTTPYRSLGLSLLMKETMDDPNLFQFLLPFSTRVWLYMLVAWLLASLMMYMCARISPYEWYSQSACVPVIENQFNALNSLWFTIGSLMQQGSDLAPRASSTRMIGTVWWFFTLILISSYTANLAAFLTVTRLNTIDNLEELAAQSKVKFGCATGGAMFNFFKNAKIPVYKRMYESMMAWNATGESFVKNTREGIAKVSEGNFALVLESTFNEFYRERNCNLTQIGGVFNPSSYAFAVRQGNTLLRDRLNEVILKLNKEQFIENLADKWLRRFNVSGKPCSELASTKGPNKGTLDVGSVGGVFLTLLIGLAIGVVISFVEMFYRACVLAGRTKLSTCQHCKNQIKLAMSVRTNKKPEDAGNHGQMRVIADPSQYTLDLLDRDKMAPLCDSSEQQL